MYKCASVSPNFHTLKKVSFFVFKLINFVKVIQFSSAQAFQVQNQYRQKNGIALVYAESFCDSF